MKNLFARLASACLLVLLSYASAAAQVDQAVPGTGGSSGNDFRARCPIGQHLLGFNLRAGDNIDAIQPICGVPTSATQVQVRGQVRGYGGTGGSPAQVVCPNESTTAVPTPVVLGLNIHAEGIDGYVLNSIGLYCGIVDPLQQIPGGEPVATYSAPLQDSTYGALASGSHVKYRRATPMCPRGLIGVGVYGRAGAAVDWLGLICGAAQTGSWASGAPSLGKRKKTAGNTGPALSICEHAEYARQRNLPVAAALEAKCRAASAKAAPSLGKKRAGAGAGTSSAASQGALAAARASVDPAIYDQYVGNYLGVGTVSREGNRLYVVWDYKWELVPQSETVFWLQSTETTDRSPTIIRFNKSSEGRVVSLSTMSPNGGENLYWREGHQPLPKNPF